MHAHYGPSTTSERLKLDALQGAQLACKAGMRAIVLKSNEYPTGPLAYIVSQVVQNLSVFGAICLNSEAGGLNPKVLETSAKLGARVVWMPTSSSNYDAYHYVFKNDGSGISILDGNGKLLPVVGEILDIINRYQLVLATGHLSPDGAFALVDEARVKGISKIVITHAIGKTPGAYFSLEKQLQLADKGAFMEHCFGTTIPTRPLEQKLDPMDIVEGVRAIGAERCILSTDFGQVHNPPPAEGMKMMIDCMLKCGLTEKEIELMVKTNPSKLLGLD